MTSDSAGVLQLGRDLAAALDRSDVVGRWLAHHLAELITASEAAPHDAGLSSTTCEVIIKLWEHKVGGNFQRDPTAYLGPVFDALGRLETNPAPWAFYRPLPEQAEPPADQLETYTMLRAACEIDAATGRLIRIAIAIASREAMSREEPWVMAGAQLADNEESRAIRQLQSLARRLRLQESLDPPSRLDSEASIDVEASHDSPARDQDPISDANLDRGTGEIEPDAALAVALEAAIDRCRNLLDVLHEVRPIPT